MQRVLLSYTKYFNTKYEKTGHVFQGTYKANHIATEQQLTYLSAYIHRNPRELLNWRNKEHSYPWSSFRDYNSNRWGKTLSPEIVLDTFETFNDYKDFVKKSGAKEKFVSL